MDKNRQHYSDYCSLWDAEDKYKRQKKKLTTFMKDWQRSTEAYLTFNAKERTPSRLSSSSSTCIFSDRRSNQQVKAINRYKYFGNGETENGHNSKLNGFLNSDRILRSTSSYSYHVPRHISSVRKRVATSHISQTPTERHFPTNESNFDADAAERELLQRISSKRRQMIPQITSPIDPPTLPRNIKHKYGSAICDELLNNEMLTNEAISKIERKDYREKKGGNLVIQCHMNHFAPSAIQTQLPYRDLSNCLRRKIFAGDATVYTRSTTQSDYCEDVYNVQFAPSKYRRKKYDQ